MVEFGVDHIMKRPREISPAELDAARRRLGYRGPPPPPGKSAYQRFLEFVNYRAPEQPTISINITDDGCRGSWAPGRKNGDATSR